MPGLGTKHPDGDVVVKLKHFESPLNVVKGGPFGTFHLGSSG
jgi:hypothetical protein